MEIVRSEVHDVFTEIVNKIALSTNDDKRIQTPKGDISYPTGKGPGRVCKEELMRQAKTKT